MGWDLAKYMSRPELQEIDTCRRPQRACVREQVPVAATSALKRSGNRINFLPLRNSTSGKWLDSHLQTARRQS